MLKAVEDGAARLLQPLGPGDVVLLVKAGPQLHEHGDILAVLRRCRQILHQLGCGGQAIDGDFNGQDGGVVGGLLHQMEEWVHRVEGVEEQGIPAENLGNHLLAPVEPGRPLGDILGVAQGGGALRGQLALQGVHIPHGQGRFGEEHMLSGQVQPLAQIAQQLLRGMSLNLQPHGGKTGPLLEHLLHVLPEVLHDVIVLILRADVGVAGDRDDMLLLHLIGVKEGVGIGQDNLLGEQVPQPPLLQPEEGGQRLGNGDQAELPLPVPAEGEDDIQALGGQMGERMVAVHHHGREHRLYIVLKPALHLLALLAVQLLRLEGADIAGPQPLFQLGDNLVPLLVQGGHRLADGLKLLGRGQAAAAVHIVLLGQGHVVDGAYPDHEELVQVAGEDGGEFQPLHQGDALVPGLLQDPFIEPQPGQLPVLGIAGIHIFRHNDSSFPGGGGSGIRPHCAFQYTTEMKKERENFVKSGINLGKGVSARTSRRPRSRGAAGCRRQSRGPCR